MALTYMLIFSCVIFTSSLDIPAEFLDCDDCWAAGTDDEKEDNKEYNVDDFILTDLS